MPRWKYVANRILTFLQNVLLNAKLSEYHTGFRAFSREVLQRLPLDSYSNDFVFDSQILTEILARGYRLGEISCPSRYFPEASSIGFRRSVIYGLGVLQTALNFRLRKWGWRKAHYDAPVLGGYAPSVSRSDPGGRFKATMEGVPPDALEIGTSGDS